MATVLRLILPERRSRNVLKMLLGIFSPTAVERVSAGAPHQASVNGMATSSAKARPYLPRNHSAAVAGWRAKTFNLAAIALATNFGRRAEPKGERQSRPRSQKRSP